VVVAVKALACELPATTGVPLARWHCPDLARQAAAQGIVASVSGTTIWRWLSADAIKPWRVRSWIFPRDPAFATKAGRVLDLYARTRESGLLGADDYVISTDEKTSIQARIRRHASLPAARRRPPRTEFEYTRGGALQYLAAWDVHRAKVFGRCEPATGIEPFGKLVTQVMQQEPYASARRVFWVADNGSSHRGQPARPPASGRLAHRAPGPPAHTRFLAQPSGDLLLGHPAQTPDPERLRQPRRGRSRADVLPGLLPADRHPVRVEVHQVRPRPPAQTPRRPRTSPGARRLVTDPYVTEIPCQSTKGRTGNFLSPADAKRFGLPTVSVTAGALTGSVAPDGSITSLRDIHLSGPAKLVTRSVICAGHGRYGPHRPAVPGEPLAWPSPVGWITLTLSGSNTRS
jgi:hypothetical protein